MKGRKIGLAALLGLLLSVAVTAQSGGSFQITQSAIAGGGENSAGGTFSLDGTNGQPAAGDALANFPFSMVTGFWNFAPLAPTAAGVSVSGRVLTANGQGIRNAVVTLTSAGGETRAVSTGSFGYFVFEQVRVGETYTLSVVSVRFVFSRPSVLLTVVEDVSEMNFVSDPR
jgi:hypothetical protein